MKASRKDAKKHARKDAKTQRFLMGFIKLFFFASFARRRRFQRLWRGTRRCLRINIRFHLTQTIEKFIS
jgi:hypothetical protein